MINASQKYKILFETKDGKKEYYLITTGALRKREVRRPKVPGNEEYGYIVDVFDGGPCVEQELKNIRAVKESRTAKVMISQENQCQGRYLVANPRLDCFRVIQGPVSIKAAGKLGITKQIAETIKVNRGNKVRYVTLKLKKQ